MPEFTLSNFEWDKKTNTLYSHCYIHSDKFRIIGIKMTKTFQYEKTETVAGTTIRTKVYISNCGKFRVKFNVI